MVKKTLFRLVKSIVLCSILSFICFFAFNIFTRAVFEGFDNLFLILYVINLLTYSIFFYVLHEKKRETCFSVGGEFNLWKEAKSYFTNEGKWLLLIYGIFAVGCEIEYAIVKQSPQKLWHALCSMFFSFMVRMHIPVLRSIASIAIVMAVTLLLVEFRSYQIYKYEKAKENE